MGIFCERGSLAFLKRRPSDGSNIDLFSNEDVFRAFKGPDASWAGMREPQSPLGASLQMTTKFHHTAVLGGGRGS